MDFKEELTALLSAQVPILHLVSYEEDRVLRTLSEIEIARDLGIIAWDMADSFQVLRPGKQPFPPKECTSDTVLPYLVEKLPPGHIVVLKDFHRSFARNPGAISRKMRNMVRGLRQQSQFLIVTSPPLPDSLSLPMELKDDIAVLEVPLPNQKELTRLFDEFTAKIDQGCLPRPEVKDKLIQSALGLTTNQARLAFSRVWARFGRFDEQGIEMVTWTKQQVIRDSGALEFWPADQGEADVGGLELLKGWLRTRAVAFTGEAREKGLPFPRGVALIGIPGTGKSLSAKMLSGLWKLPLLRLDVGSLFAGVLGTSEHNVRQAIMLAETVSPCILWIDEIEKAFAGSDAGNINAGAATRVFGTFLTWMQEHRSPVFVLATANDITHLPPELWGRFDAMFFLDLPNSVERHAILKIHLNNAGENFRKFDLNELVRLSQGFVGREIERAVREVRFVAYADGDREIEQADLVASLKETVPLSKSHTDTLQALRKWKVEGRAKPASTDEPAPTGESRRIIDA